MAKRNSLKDLRITFTDAVRLLELPAWQVKKFVEYRLLKPAISHEHGKGRHRLLIGADLVRIQALVLMEYAGIVPRSQSLVRKLVERDDAFFLTAKTTTVAPTREYFSENDEGHRWQTIGTWSHPEAPSQATGQLELKLDLAAIRAQLLEVLP